MKYLMSIPTFEVLLCAVLFSGCKATKEQSPTSEKADSPSASSRQVIRIIPADSPTLTYALNDSLLEEIQATPESDGVLTVSSYVRDRQVFLKVKNGTGQRLVYRARMKLPGRSGFIDTSIVPVFPGLSGYEHWPHEIEILELYEFELKAK